MSSILKALKKLDDDLPRKRRTVIWPSGSTPRSAMRRWDISAGRSAFVLWGLLALAVVAAAGGLYLYFKPGPDSRTETTAAVTRPISKPDSTVSTPGSTARPPATQPPQSAAPRAKPQPETAKPVPKPAPSPVVKKTPAATVRRPPPTEKKAARPSVPATASLPILTSDLKLQAISWAPAPGDRLAVINGSIVREGASLEGYVIVQIDKEEVSVRKGSEQWKLVFDLK